MTDEQRSPYTGREIDELMDRDITLKDVDGDSIGKVMEINPEVVVAETSGGMLGMGESKTYYVPREQITREEDDGWFVGVDKDDLDSTGWDQPPGERTDYASAGAGAGAGTAGVGYTSREGGTPYETGTTERGVDREPYDDTSRR